MWRLTSCKTKSVTRIQSKLQSSINTICYPICCTTRPPIGKRIIHDKSNLRLVQEGVFNIPSQRKSVDYNYVSCHSLHSSSTTSTQHCTGIPIRYDLAMNTRNLNVPLYIKEMNNRRMITSSTIFSLSASSNQDVVSLQVTDEVSESLQIDKELQIESTKVLSNERVTVEHQKVMKSLINSLISSQSFISPTRKDPIPTTNHSSNSHPSITASHVLHREQLENQPSTNETMTTSLTNEFNHSHNENIIKTDVLNSEIPNSNEGVMENSLNTVPSANSTPTLRSDENDSAVETGMQSIVNDYQPETKHVPPSKKKVKRNPVVGRLEDKLKGKEEMKNIDYGFKRSDFNIARKKYVGGKIAKLSRNESTAAKDRIVKSLLYFLETEQIPSCALMFRKIVYYQRCKRIRYEKCLREEGQAIDKETTYDTSDIYNIMQFDKPDFDGVRRLTTNADLRVSTTVKDIDPELGDRGLLTEFFFATKLKCYPIESYQILLYLQQMKQQAFDRFNFKGGHGNPHDINTYVTYYMKVCDRVSTLQVGAYKSCELGSFISNLIKDFSKFRTDLRVRLSLKLIASLLEQKVASLGAIYTQSLFDYVTKQTECKVDAYWYSIFLSHSRLSRQNDIDYSEILRLCVEGNVSPIPSTVVNALLNYSPYSDVEKTSKMLNIILQLQRAVVENRFRNVEQLNTNHQEDEQTDVNDTAVENSSNQSRRRDYIIDMISLECISAAAVQKQNSEMNFLVLSLLSVYDVAPSFNILENTALLLASKQETYHDAFHLVLEMENVVPPSDLVPVTILRSNETDPTTKMEWNSRPFVRSMSTVMRNGTYSSSEALKMIDEINASGRPITITVLNIMMSVYAERGQHTVALILLRNFRTKYNVEPNADTYSYALEALGKYLARAQRFGKFQKDIDNSLQIAEEILAYMDSQGIIPTHHILREYVELLCQADQINTATSILFDTLDDLGYVDSKSVYRVAIANAMSKQYEVARQVAQLATYAKERLLANIEKYEQIEKLEKEMKEGQASKKQKDDKQPVK